MDTLDDARGVIWEKPAYYDLIESYKGEGGIAQDFIPQEIGRSLRSVTPSFVLDVGCGEGSLVRYLGSVFPAQTSFHGIEVSEEGLRRANGAASESTSFHLYDGRRIPFVDNFFDAVISTFVFEHLTEPESVFHEMVRVTRPGGRVIIACPNFGSPFFRSPCNIGSPFILMVRRIFQGFLPSRFFTDRFRWQRVQPLIIGHDEHKIDYDTLSEPSILTFKKFARQHVDRFTLLRADSFWSRFSYGGRSFVKSLFFSVVKFLADKGFPLMRDSGPFFYVELEKSHE